MSLGADVQAALPQLRAQAESLMIDACTISGGTTSVFNEETFEYETVTAETYSGPCRLRFAATAVQDVEAAGQLLVVQRATLSLPIATSGAVLEGHVATITACVNDPALVGRKFRIEGGHHQTFATARRFPVEEIT